jgi:hypothetical protein
VEVVTILFSQCWDVITDKYDAYSTFISKRYNPGLEKLGMQLLGGYYVAVGEGPRIVAVATLDEKEDLFGVLSSREYRILSTELIQLVCNFGSRVWISSGRIHEQPYRIQTGAWKFTQRYNIVRGKEEEHYRFVKEECLPVMKALKLPITGGWRLAVGSGPRTLAESTGRTMEHIVTALDTTEFRKLVRTLKIRYATDYSSRILTPTGRIEVPYLIKEMVKGI